MLAIIGVKAQKLRRGYVWRRVVRADSRIASFPKVLQAFHD